MRILLLNQFYPPDTAATGQLLGDMALGLAGRGHEVHVVCSAGAYGGGAGDRRQKDEGRRTKDEGRRAKDETGQTSPAASQHPLQRGIHVYRVRALGLGRGNACGRCVDYALFHILALIWALRLPRMDVCVALTTPPFIGMVGAVLGLLRGTRLVLWSMDLYPEVLSALGGMPRCALVYRVLARIAQTLYGRCAVVVSLGGQMTERLVEAGVVRERIVEVHNWVPGERPLSTEETERCLATESTENTEGEAKNLEFRSQESTTECTECTEEFLATEGTENTEEEGKNPEFRIQESGVRSQESTTEGTEEFLATEGTKSAKGENQEGNGKNEDCFAQVEIAGKKMAVMYSGNLGLGHDLETFVRAAVLLRDVPLELTFAGTGMGRVPLEALAKELGLESVRFQESAPLERLAETLASAQIHLVSQKPGTQGFIVPSKIYGILAAERAAVFVGPEDCEVAEILRESGAGFVMIPGDVAGTAAALRRLAGDGALRADMGEKGRLYYEANFGRARSVGKLVDLIEATGNSNCCTPPGE